MPVSWTLYAFYAIFLFLYMTFMLYISYVQDIVIYICFVTLAVKAMHNEYPWYHSSPDDRSPLAAIFKHLGKKTLLYFVIVFF